MTLEIMLEELDQKIADVFGHLDEGDCFYPSGLFSEIEKAFEGVSLPWVKYCVESLLLIELRKLHKEEISEKGVPGCAKS